MLTLHIFPGDGESMLYEDDGQSTDYRQGAFRITRFRASLSAGVLTIERNVSGSFQPSYRHLELLIHGVGDTAQVTAGGAALSGSSYDPQAQMLRLVAEPAAKYTVDMAP